MNTAPYYYLDPDNYLDPDPYFEQYVGYDSSSSDNNHSSDNSHSSDNNQITDDLIEFSQSIDPTRKNLIFDIDGTIFDSSYEYESELKNSCELKDGIRPNFDKLLVYCVENDYKIYLWTAGSRLHALNILNSLEHIEYITKILCRGTSWFNGSKIEKKLSLLSNDISNILLIDNTHSISIGQKDNVIIVPTYDISSKLIDNVILDLLEIFKAIPKTCNLVDYVKCNLLNVII